MKKAVKIILWSFGGLLAVLLVLVATMPLWVGTVARPIVNGIVPKITKTSFNIGHLYVNPWTGRVEVGDFVLGNPDGYSDPRAVELKSLVFDLDVTKTVGGPVWVEEVTVDGLFVSYAIGGENNVDNIKQILINVAGGKEKYDAQQARKAALKAEQAAKDEAAKEAAEKAAEEAEEKLEEEDDGDEPMKFVVDSFVLRDVKVKVQVVTLPVPNFTLTDIGKDSGGATVGDILDDVWSSILSGASSLGDGAKTLGGLINKGAGAAVDAVGEGAKKTADSVKKLFNFK